MSEAHQLPITSPPDIDTGPVSGIQQEPGGPTGPFFVIDCQHIGESGPANEKIFTSDSQLEELPRTDLIPLAKSGKDIVDVVIDLALGLKILPNDEAKLKQIKAVIQVEQEEVEKLPWDSGSGHYDPEEANTLRQQTKDLEEIDLLREAIRLRTENPIERNQRVEMVVRRLVRNEVELVESDAVQ